MRRRVEVPSRTTLDRYSDGSAGVKIPVESGNLHQLILELCLPAYDLAERVTIAGRHDGVSIVLRKDSSLEFGGARVSDRIIDCALPDRDLETVTAFLLRYFRDGLAPVNHIDIDLAAEDQTVSGLTLVWQVSETHTPMSGDEAKRILGIE